MPQMAPLNWLMLLIYMIMIFFLINSITYFLTSSSLINSSNFKNNKKLYIWKW
uniref:ATP synthase complex subunit 8 n=1 Tax=Aderidae sp. GENSP01 TaxID=1205532 RepID=A0A0S2MP89_9CUCU|nr:ATP synthase F0 subunit 8 [Aderidae sp. GENSP01]